MRQFQSMLVRFLINILFIIGFSYFSFGQKPKLSSTSWRDNWKFDLKIGSGVLLSEVPTKYLDRINNVNIPLWVPGATGVVSVKKGLSPHLEMGFQVDYTRIQGNVKQDNTNYNVLTQSLGYSFLVLYNLKRTDEFRPRLNYFMSYKIGAISLKNDPKEIMTDGSQISISNIAGGGKFIKNVAIITGLGIGFNYQFTNNLSTIGVIEMNRSSDALSEIYRIDKIIYHSTNTVNNYSSITAGLCYSFNFSKRKKSTYFNSGTETNKRLLQYKITRAKGKSSKSNRSIWYNKKKSSH